MTLSAFLFDKDGTLFDFAATWNGWAFRMLRDLSGGDKTRLERLARAVDFDLATRRFRPESIVIAGTNLEIAHLLSAELDSKKPKELERFLAETAAEAELVQAVPLAPFLDGLAARGLRTGVMTNDSEVSAHSHLTRTGIMDRFDLVLGADSGFGAKPKADPLLAFCSHVDVAPEHTAMVGDSLHDLIAGRAAGMVTVGVLTGMADEADLRPYADIVLPNIGHIPAWLDSSVGTSAAR